MQITRLNYRKTGGFRGVFRGCDLEISHLEEGERGRLELLIQNSNLLALSSRTQPRAKDVYYYHFIATTPDGKEHKWKFDDITLPSQLKPLVQYLDARASDNQSQGRA